MEVFPHGASATGFCNHEDNMRRVTCVNGTFNVTCQESEYKPGKWDWVGACSREGAEAEGLYGFLNFCEYNTNLLVMC